MDVIKYVGKYLNKPIGQVCYSTDKVLTMSLNKENFEGFANIVLQLSCCELMSPMIRVQTYQWLEHIAMYYNQAAANPNCAKIFLQGFNRALEKTTYLTGNSYNVADVATYHVLYPFIERLSIVEQESLLHLCRWFKHIQTLPKVCESRLPLSLNALSLSSLAPSVH